MVFPLKPPFGAAVSAAALPRGAVGAGHGARDARVVAVPSDGVAERHSDLEDGHIPWKTAGSHRRNIGKSWEIVGKHGNIVGTWENHGKIMGNRRKTWKIFGKIVGKHGKSWENSGKMVGKHEENIGNRKKT
jgi:hypothetical protein